MTIISSISPCESSTKVVSWCIGAKTYPHVFTRVSNWELLWTSLLFTHFRRTGTRPYNAARMRMNRSVLSTCRSGQYLVTDWWVAGGMSLIEVCT